MNNTDATLRDELITALRDVVARSETAYLRLGRRFPELLREMQSSLARSRGTLASLEANRASGRDGMSARSRASLADTVSRTQQRITTTIASFESLHGTDEQLLDRLRSQLEHLTALDNDIAEIKDDSIEMELVSLNAMTVALKSGSAGRAFSYITEELKRISESTIRLTEEITRRGAALQDTFERFRSSLQQASDFQQRLSGHLRERLESSFGELRDGVTHVVETVRRVHEQAGQVTQPLNRIMEEVQLHHVIKQSIDHVIISLHEISQDSDETDEINLLDELRFLQLLPPLCGELLDDAAAKLEGSVAVFRDQIGVCRELIETAERERRVLLNIPEGESSAGAALPPSENHPVGPESVDLHELYERSSNLIEELLADLSASLKMKEQVASESQRLLREVGLLENGFETFTRIITRFRSIDVASRIEVAKQQVLQQMSDTVGRMNSLTRKIERDVDRSLQATKRFISETSELLREHQTGADTEHRLAREFHSAIKQGYSELYQVQNELLEAIGGFSVFTGRFLTLIDEAAEDLQNLDTLLAELRRIKAKTSEIRERATAQMEPLLRKHEVDSWQIGNERLQAIIERLTFFTHKIAAGELVEFEVEDDVASGEVTLF